MERFFDLSVDLMAISDLSTEILQASASFRRIGWEPEEAVGQRVLDLIHPDDLAIAQDELARILEGGEAVAVTVRLRGGDGVYRWVQGNAIAALDTERIYFTGADITARKELEDQLRERVRLEELVASVAAGLVGIEAVSHADVEDAIEEGLARIGRALGADGAHLLRTGPRTDDAVYVEWVAGGSGRRARDRIPLSEAGEEWWRKQLAGGPVHIHDVDELEPEAGEVATVLRQMGARSFLLVPLERSRAFRGFIGLTTRAPRRFSEDVASLLRVAGESFMGVLSRTDATAALLDARRELEVRNRDLERSNEDLERFAYAAAHDLKAPLARIEMALAAAARDAGHDDELLGIAQRGAGRMRQLIEDLLAYATAGSPSEAPEPVDLDALLGEVLADLAPAIEAAGGEVQRAPLPTVVGYRSQLEQLLQNLVGNAVKFARSDVPPRIVVSAETHHDGITVTIADNGIGIDPAHRSDVFGVFTRLHGDDAYAGSGIGLATCAKVVAQHAGRIWIDDGIDGGTAVRVWLPA